MWRGGRYRCFGFLSRILGEGERKALFIKNSVTDLKAGHHVCNSVFLERGVKIPSSGQAVKMRTIYI